MIKGSGKLYLVSRQTTLPEVVPTAEGAIVLKAIRDFRIVTGDGFVPAYKDGRHDALAINPEDYKDKFAAAETKFTGETGNYDITLTTMAEVDGESTYKLIIDGECVGRFTNPETSQDYKPTPKTWKNISVDKEATIRVEIHIATNSKAKQGRRMSYARRCWLALTLTPTGVAETSKGVEKAGVRVRDTSTFGSDETTIFEETVGLFAVEVEHFAVQTETDVRSASDEKL